MELKQLNIFTSVAKLGSFAAVAKAQHLDPSSVSRSVAALEHELGIRLFQRTTRKLTLTEAGRRYFARVEDIIEALEAAADEARANEEPSGLLRLTSSVAFGCERLTPLLPAFCRAYPKIKIDLHLTDENLDLVAEGLDLAIRLSAAIEGNLVGSKLHATHYRVVASEAYLRQAPALRSPSDLALHTCPLLNLPHYRSRWLFKDEKNRVEEVAVSGSVRVSSVPALKACARAGMGPVLLADWMLADESAESLINLFPKHQVTATSFETGVWMVYPSRTYLPRRVRAMIDFLKTALT